MLVSSIFLLYNRLLPLDKMISKRFFFRSLSTHINIIEEDIVYEDGAIAGISVRKYFSTFRIWNFLQEEREISWRPDVD